MTSVLSHDPVGHPEQFGPAGQVAKARRPGRSARAGCPCAGGAREHALTDAQWQTRVPGDGRKIGVVVHHVASVYPLEIQLAQTVAGGKPVTGVTME